MDKIRYKNSEKAAITIAYVLLRDRLTCTLGGSLSESFKRAQKSAYKAAHFRVEAKAWILEGFLRGFQNGDVLDARDLVGLVDWRLFSILAGVGYYDRKGQLENPKDHDSMYKAIKEAVLAHKWALARQEDTL